MPPGVRVFPVALVSVMEIVLVPTFKVSPVTVAVVQMVPVPVSVQVPDPMVSARVFEFVLEKLPIVRF